VRDEDNRQEAISPISKPTRIQLPGEGSSCNQSSFQFAQYQVFFGMAFLANLLTNKIPKTYCEYYVI
jgi:hypothetical protein